MKPASNKANKRSKERVAWIAKAINVKYQHNVHSQMLNVSLAAQEYLEAVRLFSLVPQSDEVRSETAWQFNCLKIAVRQFEDAVVKASQPAAKGTV